MKVGFSYTKIEACLDSLVKMVNIDIEPTTEYIDNAIGKVAYRDIISPLDIPPYDRSAVDGYAICSEAVVSASPNNPIPLALKDKGDKISCSEAAPISTGERLPIGADAVVMVEDTYIDSAKNLIYVTRPASKYLNVSRAGEDIRRGDTIVERGRVLRPWHIAAIAAVGLNQVQVYRPVRIGVLTIGSELRDSIGGVDVYKEGGVIDTTSKIITATLKEYKFLEPRWYGIVPDEGERIALLLQRALNENDIVITSGGTGPGDRDATFGALNFLKEKMKISVISRGIAMKPGRPTTIVSLDGKPLFMLSGFPVAAYIALKALVLPFIVRVLDIKGIEAVEVPAVLTRRVVGSIGYDVFVRVRAYRCDDNICADPMAVHGSGVLKTLLDSNAILRIPHNLEGYERGEKVWIQML